MVRQAMINPTRVHVRWSFVRDGGGVGGSAVYCLFPDLAVVAAAVVAVVAVVVILGCAQARDLVPLVAWCGSMYIGQTAPCLTLLAPAVPRIQMLSLALVSVDAGHPAADDG